MSTSRRHFLGAALLGLAAGQRLPADSATLKTSFAGTPSMKLGLVTYNLAKDWGIDTIIKNCASAGFAGVELRTTHKHGVEVSLTAAQRDEVRQRFADSPVQLMGLGSAFDFHTPDPAKLRKDIEDTKAYLQLAHDVGASGVKVRPNDLPKDVPVEKTLEQIGRSLRELGQFGDALGQAIRLEVHGPGTAKLENIRRIMDVADHPNVGVCWNSNPDDLQGGGFDANFDLVKDRIIEVHLRDLFLEDYPFRKLFARLKETGYSGWTMAEIPDSADPLRVMRYFRGLWLAYQNAL
jgi:sugar phosphate isomerase/epimerase